MNKLFTVKGIACKGFAFKPKELDVRISNDKFGKSLSISDNEKGIMFQIPVTNEMIKELTKKS